MKANVSSVLLNFEIVVPDAEEAYRLLHNVFGAEKVQENFFKFLDSSFLKIIHVNLGGVVLQLIQPHPAGSWQVQKVEKGVKVNNFTFHVKDLQDAASWQAQLQKNGAGLHNITLIVDNIHKAVEALKGEGAPVMYSVDVDWAKILGPENVKPNPNPVYMINTMEKLGFNLELFESPSDKDLGSLI